MSHAQDLLRRLLDQAGGPGETGYLLVIDSEGLEDLPDQLVTRTSAHSIHRVTTELRLRHLIWQSNGAPLIAVMPEELARRIQRAPDLLRRARNQRVHALSVNDVLEVVLGVRVVGAETPYMQQLALEYVEKLGIAMSQRTLPTVVDRRLLTEMLIDVSVGEQVRTRTPAQLLASWIETLPEWSDNVRQLVREALPTIHGDEGRLLSWALQDSETRLRELVVHGAVLTVEVDAEEIPKPAWGPLWKASALPPLELDRRILRRALTRLADESIALLADAQVNELLVEADRLGRSCLGPRQLQTSRLLSLAFEDRAHDLATEAAAGKAISAADVSWLATHRAARMHAAELAVLEALARLSRYLQEAPEVEGDVLEQIRNYQRHGAFADLGVMQLRRALAGCASHHAEANKVLAAVRARRDGENRRFADTIASSYEANLHQEGVTPLHRIWKRVVSPLWQKEPTAGIYLVVLDGCSYPIFLELLRALAGDSSFSIGIRPDEDGRVIGLPGLSPLPTVTSHARGAIFLGEIPNDPLVAETVFADQDEARTDKARFAQNAALGSHTRRLFLKSDLADGGMALLAALGDRSIDVVAAVFNAVDDQIGSSNTGATVRLGPEDIMAFKPSLQKALREGRRVLVTADHGHSPFVTKTLRAGAGKTPRYVALGADEAVPDGFIEIDLKGLGGPPQRRAFAWRGGAYMGNPQVGFHGGCGLEEMVVPLAWLERDGLQADEPVWWYGQGALVRPAVEVPIQPPLAVPVPSDEIVATKPTQLSLFEPADKADLLPLPAALISRMQIDEKRVLVLLKENGTARASELASRLGKNPGRLNGLMRTLRRTLHGAGVVLFTDEVLPTGETLYRYQSAATENKEITDAPSA